MNTPPLSTPRQILEHLLERRSLSEGEAASLLKILTAPDLPPAMAGALLVALRAKGVTAFGSALDVAAFEWAGREKLDPALFPAADVAVLGKVARLLRPA